MNELKIDKPKAIPLIERPPDKTSMFGDKLEFGGKKEPIKTSVYEEAMQPKGSWLSRADVGAPYKAWKKATIAPAGSALAAAAIAAAGTYYAAPWLMKKLRGNLPESAQEGMSDEDIAKMRNRMAILAALGVGGLSIAGNFNPKYPVQSMTNWNYGNLQKKAEFADFSNQAVMQQDLIPLDHAKEIVANDRFLTSGQKAAIGTIFDKTPDQSGNASMADITSGAIRAGLGFAGGAIAGYALGKIFALPPAVTRAASLTGGLANALRTSGLIS